MNLKTVLTFKGISLWRFTLTGSNITKYYNQAFFFSMFSFGGSGSEDLSIFQTTEAKTFWFSNPSWGTKENNQVNFKTINLVIPINHKLYEIFKLSSSCKWYNLWYNFDLCFLNNSDIWMILTTLAMLVGNVSPNKLCGLNPCCWIAKLNIKC